MARDQSETSPLVKNNVISKLIIRSQLLITTFSIKGNSLLVRSLDSQMSLKASSIIKETWSKLEHQKFVFLPQYKDKLDGSKLEMLNQAGKQSW